MTAAIPCPSCGADLAGIGGPNLACSAGHVWRWNTASGMPALVAVRGLSAPSAPPRTRDPREVPASAPADDPRPAPVAAIRYSRASARRIVPDALPARWRRRPSRLERLILAVRLVRQLVDPAEPCPYCPTPVFARRPMAHMRRTHPPSFAR